MQAFMLLGAALFQKAEERNESQNRRIRQDISQLEEMVRQLLQRGDLLRLRGFIVQDFLLGLLAGGPRPSEPSIVPKPPLSRPVLEEEG